MPFIYLNLGNPSVERTKPDVNWQDDKFGEMKLKWASINTLGGRGWNFLSHTKIKRFHGSHWESLVTLMVKNGVDFTQAK